MENKKRKKYPKSINNRQCLGPCYEPNTTIMHPVFISNVKNDLYPGIPFCPTDFYEYTDERTGAKKQVEYDMCENHTHNKDASTPETLTILQSGFTKDIFLSLYYEINSFEEMCEWIKTNKFVVLETKERIVNASLNLYGDKLDFFDEIFVDFYINYIKEKFLRIIYKDIHKYIGIENNYNEILIVDKSNNKLDIDDHSVERINYIAEKFLNYTETKKFLTKFLKSKKILFADYDNPLYLIYKAYVEYIKNTISLILEKKE
jgi:hypothetical protein